MPVISAIIGAVSAIMSFSVAGALTVGQLVTGVMLIGSVASAYMQQLAARKMRAALAGLAEQGFTTTVRGSVIPQRTIYGEVLTGVALLYETVKPPKYIAIGVFAAHEIDQVIEIRVNGKPVMVDATGAVVSDPYWIRSTSPFSSGYSLMQISIRMGTDDQDADPLIMSLCPELTASFRQQGHATIAWSCDWGPDRDTFDRVWGGTFPTVTAVVRGKKIYDPRDAAQRLDDRSTWRWANAPALVGADILRHDDFGRMAPAEVMWDRIATAASIDDQTVTTRDGSVEPRYTCDGIIDTSAALSDALRGVLTADRGALVRAPAGYFIRSGWMQEPVTTIHAGLVVGAISYRSDAPRDQMLNTVRTRFVAPDREYQVVDGPVIEDTDARLLDGEALETTLELRFTKGAPRAQRLGWAALRDARLGRQTQVPLDIEALGLEPSDWVRVDLEPLPALVGIYETTSIAFSENFTVMAVTLSETDRSIFEFDPTSQEKPFEYEDVA